jgi:hypothetical protein
MQWFSYTITNHLWCSVYAIKFKFRCPNIDFIWHESLYPPLPQHCRTYSSILANISQNNTMSVCIHPDRLHTPRNKLLLDQIMFLSFGFGLSLKVLPRDLGDGEEREGTNRTFISKQGRAREWGKTNLVNHSLATIWYPALCSGNLLNKILRWNLKVETLM